MRRAPSGGARSVRLEVARGGDVVYGEDYGAAPHIVAVLAIYRCSTMAQTGVSGPVVVDGESFLDALFASAGQG